MAARNQPPIAGNAINPILARTWGIPMSTKKEFRFAAGSKQAKKSSVWSVKVSGSDIYLFSSLFGGKQKVSLHDGGHAQWSMTQEWVAENPGMKNQKRHIAKWQYERPSGVVAACIFRVRIPQSQLRARDHQAIGALAEPGGFPSTHSGDG